MGMNMPQQPSLPQSQLDPSQGQPPQGLDQTPQNIPNAVTTGSSSDIPTMLQMNLQITIIALLKLMQNQLTAATNSYEKTKNIPPISQAITSLHTAFHNTEQLNFEKTKPDKTQVDAQIAQQDAHHNYAMDLMAQQHDEQMKQHQASLAQQAQEHQQKLAELKAMIEQQAQQQQMGHTDALHQSELEKENIAKATLLQQAQHQEEQHQQQMSIAEQQAQQAAQAAQQQGSTSKP